MNRRVFWIAVVYTVASVGYIFISDALLAELALTVDVATIMKVSAIKGVVFVVLSGLGIGVVLARTHSKLEESDRHLMRLFEAHPDPMWTYDVASLKIIEANDAAVKLYGYSREEFNGMELIRLRPLDEYERFYEHLKSINEADVTDSGLWRHQTKNGKAIWANVRSNKVVLDGNTVRLVVATNVTTMVTDWSERRTVDPTIYQALQRLKIVADSIQDGFVFLNDRMEIIQANPTFCNKTNNNESTITGLNLFATSSWLDAAKLNPVFTTIRNTGKSGTTELYNSDAGEWYRIVVYPTVDGFAMFLRDITTEMAAERLVRVEHGRLTTLINNTDSLIFTLDRNRHLTLYNNSFAELVLHTRAYPPILGEYPADIPTLRQLHEIWDDVFDKVLDGTIHTSEVLIGQDPSKQRYRLLRMAPLVADNTIVGVGVVMQDIHELRTSLNKLKERNKVLSDIAQVSSHDLRGPLSAIMTLLSLIDVDDIAAPSNADVLRQLRSISTDVDEIVHTIVTMTRELRA